MVGGLGCESIVPEAKEEEWPQQASLLFLCT
jgi:hypothetical protein